MTAKPENKRRSESKASPFAGCSIVVAAMISMLFLVGFVIWNLNRLDHEISAFTQDDPQAIPVLVLTEHTKALNDLKARLNTFEAGVAKEEEVELPLSATDLNLGIAAFEAFADLRGKFSVKEIKDGRLFIDIAFPLNGKPMSGELRYLNGTLVTAPRLTDGEIVLDIEEVRVPKGEVPEGFLGQLSPHRITERYKEDPILGPWLTNLTSVRIAEDVLILAATKQDAIATTDPAEVTSAAKRALMLFGVLVLLLFLTLALVFVFTKKRRALNAAAEAAASDGEER